MVNHKVNKTQSVKLIISRWIDLNSQIDTTDFSVALQNERDTFNNVINNANINNAMLINCTKTGQPIGQLFNHVKDSYLPNSIAPNWIRTGTQALQNKLNEQPCALLVYLIEKICLGYNGLQNYVSNTFATDDVVEIIDISNGLRAECYEKIVCLDKSAVMGLLYLLNDTYEFLKYPSLAVDKMKSVGLCCYECESEDLYSDLIEKISGIYEFYFSKIVTANEIKGIATLDDNDFIQQVDRLMNNAAKSIHDKKAEDVYRNKLLNMPSHNRLSRVGLKAKADFELYRELENSGIATLTAADIGFSDMKAKVEVVKAKVKPRKRNIFDVIDSEANEANEVF